jgi:phosphatidylglycerophosphate synthase
MVAVILGRELSVTVLRGMIHARGQSLPASPLGKIKMAAQVAAILLLILAPHTPGLFVMGRAALWVATIAALVSAADYWRRYSAGLAVRPAPPAAVDRDRARNRLSA